MIGAWHRGTLLAALACWPVGQARAASPFSVGADQGVAIRLADQTIARAQLPEGFEPSRLVRQKGGCTAVGPKCRQEWALFDDRLEYTFQLQLDRPIKPWCVLELPLPERAGAAVVHGTFEQPPRTTEIRGDCPDFRASENGTVPLRPPGKTKGNAGQIEMVRFITVQGPAASYALDTQPAGAMGEDPGNTAGVMRAVVCCRAPGGLVLRAVLPGAYPARMRLKFIFYAPPRPFPELHPFVLMNYRYAFEKALKLDFTAAPMPKKRDEPRSVGTQPYGKKAGYGWLGDTGQLELSRTSLRQPLYGDYVGSRRPGRFRIDVPPGHYYLPLNVGRADGPAGPMRVLVDGQPRIERLALEPGRFKAELLWITTGQDHLEIEFQGLDGAAWQIGALTLSAVGTLGDDFTLTRAWWHLPLIAAGTKGL